MLRSLLVLCFALGFFARADEPEPDPALTKAKKAYSESSDKAKAALLEAFATAIKTATASGNLDVVKALQAEKEAFEAGGKLPASARLKQAATTYQATMRQAARTLEKDFDQTIKDLTKAGKLAQAEAAQAELKELRSRTVATKEDLQKHLSDSVWAWDDGLKLNADGSTEQRAWQAARLVTRWEAVDRRTVVLWIERGRDSNRTATLVFNEEMTEATGFGFDGARIKSLKRK
jgi:hypothetical protein